MGDLKFMFYEPIVAAQFNEQADGLPNRLGGHKNKMISDVKNRRPFWANRLLFDQSA